MRRIDLLRETQQQLLAAQKPTVEALWILSYCLEVEERQLATNLLEEVSDHACEAVRAMVGLRRAGHPLQLLLGTAVFYGHKLKVKRNVLVPRPETEGLVEKVFSLLVGQSRPKILDIGTGTGAIAITLKLAIPQAVVWASDISQEAIDLATENASGLQCDITFCCQPFIPKLSDNVALSDLDMVVSNPPYLPSDYKCIAPRELSYELDSALYSGPDGLEAARDIAKQSWKALKPLGWLALELDPSNVYLMRDELAKAGWAEAVVYMDLTGRARYLVARKPSTDHTNDQDAVVLAEA